MAEQKKKAAKPAPAPETPELNESAPDETGTARRNDEPGKTSAEAGLKKVSDLAEAKQLATWQTAALLRAQGWTGDKLVTETEFDQALNALKSRGQGGNHGRRH